MGLLDWFESRWKRESSMYKYAPIAPANVASKSGTATDEPFSAGDHYFRLWLVEMFLANDREWFTAWHPAVHAAIDFRFGDRKEILTRVAGAGLLPDLSSENLDRVVGMNYAMTPLMPFNGGSIELSAGLLAIAGKNDVKGFLKVLGDFSDLLMVPQLSTALAIATPLANGLSELVGATENRLMLGLHQTWTAGTAGAAPLQAGYFTVILADDAELDNDKLWVENGRLKYGDSLASAEPLQGYNYMLFRLERRDERDDWDSLSTIQEPYNKAIEMLRVGNTDQADAYIRSAKAAAFMANELTRNVDQRRVVMQIQKRYDDARENMGLGAFSEDEDTSFNAIMQGAMAVEEARALGSLLPEDVGLEGLSIPEEANGGDEIHGREEVEADDAAKDEEPSRHADLSRSAKVRIDAEDMSETVSEPRIVQGEQFFFALEGEAVKGDAVQFGTNVDLLFDYALVNREVVAVLKGRELESARRADADLGITVIPKGFSFRAEDAAWYKVARFRGGRLENPVRFLLRAIEEEAAETAAGTESAPDSSLILQTGFQIMFEIEGITVYDFPLVVRLVRSIAEVEEPTHPRPPLVLHLDKSAGRAEKALKIIEGATGVRHAPRALRSVFEPEPGT